MRHSNDGRKFGRNSSHRRAMFKNLAANLILNERIVTTDAKAKELRRVAEKLITKARRAGATAYTAQAELTPAQRGERLSLERSLEAEIPRYVTKTEAGGTLVDVDLVEKILLDYAKRFATRNGGYTRIIKLAPRRGDNAPMACIEFLPAAAEGASA